MKQETSEQVAAFLRHVRTPRAILLHREGIARKLVQAEYE